MRICLIVVALLLSASCASQSEEVKLPKHDPLFSLRLTQGAFSGPVTATTGWLFFVEESAPVKGPFLLGYRLEHGKILELLSTGSSSAAVVAAIDAIDFEPFDWKSEVAAAQTRLQKSLKGKDEAVALPMTLDGAEWELALNLKRGSFSMQEWNPGPLIDFYAAYSEKIAKLKRIIDTLALYEGRHKLEI